MTEESTQIRRLRLRSWRRGIREMDLILGSFADERLAELPADELDLYEEMLEENDQELYTWVSGRTQPPPRFADLVARVSEHVERRRGASRS